MEISSSRPLKLLIEYLGPLTYDLCSECCNYRLVPPGPAPFFETKHYSIAMTGLEPAM